MNIKNNTISSNFITFNWNNRSQMNHKYARNVHRFAAIALVLNEWKCTIILCLRSKCQYWKHANIPLSIPQMDKYTLIPILLLLILFISRSPIPILPFSPICYRSKMTFSHMATIERCWRAKCQQQSEIIFVILLRCNRIISGKTWKD